MKKDIGKKVAKRIDQVEKQKDKKYEVMENERDSYKQEVEYLEGKQSKNQKKEKEQSFLLAGIAGILMGAFFGNR